MTQPVPVSHRAWWPHRRVALAAAAVVLAAATALGAARYVSGHGPLTVSGTITDPAITDKTGCEATGTLLVVLTDAGGRVIARDQAPFAWQGGGCVITFAFPGVPRLPGYGIREPGLGNGTVWLTPAQATQPVRLRLG